MNRLAWCAAALLAASFWLPARGAEPDDELKKLQGTWVVESMEFRGKPASAERIKGRKAVVEGKTFSDHAGDKVVARGTITVDPSKSPRTLDSTFTEGDPAGKTTKAIYELDGDTWKVCTARPDADRPSAFTTKEGTGLMLVVYKRAKP